MTTRMSSRDFNQRVNEAKKASNDGPVFITQRGKPQHVLLSIDAYERLTGLGGRISELVAEPSGIEFDPPTLSDLAAAWAAKLQGAMIVLNAAPARHASKEFLDLVDVLVVNRVEAAMLSGSDDIDAALKALHRPTRDVVLTQGGEGVSVIARSGQVSKLSALAVKLVSSHGAGDCFCGALAARLAAYDGLTDACAYARTAAGIFVAMAEERKHEISDQMVRERMK